MTIQEHIGLAGYTTFGIGGPARFFVQARTEAEVDDAVRWAHDQDLPLFVLGGGSNLLVPDTGFPGLVLRIDIRGITQPRPGVFDVGAGESWDTFVRHAIAADCAGIECLAGIPGSVGGTPVQNVGAYGQEVSETVLSVRVLERTIGHFVDLSNADCTFRYRESLFNTTDRGRYVVTQVRFALHPHGPATVKYADLRKRFEGQPPPTLAEVAAAVREIRASKGMLLVEGDVDCRSAGSFFKNPIVPIAVLQSIGDAPHWPAGEGMVKLPAAWLLEHAGFIKGFGSGPVGLSTKHTLALTNRGGATFADVAALEQQIIHGVEQKFGITLVREPVVLS